MSFFALNKTIQKREKRLQNAFHDLMLTEVLMFTSHQTISGALLLPFFISYECAASVLL